MYALKEEWIFQKIAIWSQKPFENYCLNLIQMNTTVALNEIEVVCLPFGSWLATNFLFFGSILQS